MWRKFGIFKTLLSYVFGTKDMLSKTKNTFFPPSKIDRRQTIYIECYSILSNGVMHRTVRDAMCCLRTKQKYQILNEFDGSVWVSYISIVQS